MSGPLQKRYEAAKRELADRGVPRTEIPSRLAREQPELLRSLKVELEAEAKAKQEAAAAQGAERERRRKVWAGIEAGAHAKVAELAQDRVDRTGEPAHVARRAVLAARPDLRAELVQAAARQKGRDLTRAATEELLR